MKKWLLLPIAAFLAAGFQTHGFGEAVAEEKICAQGRAIFGKLSCAIGEDSENLLDAYFFGATSLVEIQKTYSDRFEKIRSKCDQKNRSRRLASQRKVAPHLPLKLKVETVESCVGKRGYEQPCVTNADCIENFCHPDRGTCSAIFTMPISAAQ